MKPERYKRDSAISYALGTETVIELLKRRPDCARTVYIHPDFRAGEGKKLIETLCADNSVYMEYGEKPFNILTQKENCFAIGSFEKYAAPLDPSRDHIVLVNPSNAGNLGTIIRTASGFGLPDIAVISPGADFFDPKTIRASIGAAFSVRSEYFASFDEYIAKYGERTAYPFMLKAKNRLSDVIFQHPASLIFGNEAAGLPDSFLSYPDTVVIPHSNAIDSLNLPIAAGIAMYALTTAK